MKSSVNLLLLCSLVVCGCYSFSTISEGEREQILADPGEQIRIHLDDTSTITLSPYHFTQVQEPSDFVYGSGARWDSSARHHDSFRGKSPFISVDTVYHTTGPLWNLHKEINYCEFVTPDSSTLRFAEDNFFVVRRDGGTGLWCAGQKESDGHSEWFTGRIPTGRIVQIETQKISVVRTGIAVAGLAATVYLLSKTFIYHPIGGWLGGSWEWDWNFF